MHELFLRTYHRLPFSMRSIAAGIWGYHLRSWRYGSETEKLVEEALSRENWNFEQWKSWQEERVGYLLHEAATRVPYYREQWRKRRRCGDWASWEYLQNWPVLEKEPLRQNPISFVADDCRVAQMYHEHTSGTTGKPLELWMCRQTVRRWYALFEARIRHWNHLSLQDPWAILGGQLVTPVKQKEPPFWVWNGALHQLYMSSYHLSPNAIPHYLEALKRYRIKYIYGYTSALHAIAQEILILNRRDVHLSIAITNAEPLFDFQRHIIQEAFQCPVRETYGMSELVAAASECEKGQLHLWPEVGWLEVDQKALLNGDMPSGEFICTGLINGDMPLIRYRVGDRGTVMTKDELCSCGRSLPILRSVDGRSDDILHSSDGRSIPRLDPVFKAHLALREAQIVQERLDKVRVRYVPAPGFNFKMQADIAHRLQQRLGEIEVVFEPVNQIPRTRNGKFRAVICAIPEMELAKSKKAKSEQN